MKGNDTNPIHSLHIQPVLPTPSTVILYMGHTLLIQRLYLATNCWQIYLACPIFESFENGFVNWRSAEGATAVGANATSGNGGHGEEESHLLKEVRSSSLKTEMYRQIWQRRVLWFGQTLPSFESRSTIEFWSGWTNRPSGQQSTSGANGSNSATTPPTSSTTRRKKYQ